MGGKGWLDRADRYVAPVLSMTAAQLISDATALLKVGGGYHISISGTATAQQVANANANITLVDHLSAGFAISDNASNVTAHLDALQVLAAAAVNWRRLH